MWWTMCQAEGGDKVKLALVRDGHPSTVQVTLGELPAAWRGARRPGWKDKVGVQLQTLTPDMHACWHGSWAKVRWSAGGSRRSGRKAGLRAEDVIVEIDRKPVTSAEER